MRPRKPLEAPAFFSLLVFLGINYLIGYEIGRLLTGSTIGAVAVALLMPCLSLVGYALISARRARRRAARDKH
jgi:uncharacterized membrane protein